MNPLQRHEAAIDSFTETEKSLIAQNPLMIWVCHPASSPICSGELMSEIHCLEVVNISEGFL